MEYFAGSFPILMPFLKSSYGLDTETAISINHSAFKSKWYSHAQWFSQES